MENDLIYIQIKIDKVKKVISKEENIYKKAIYYSLLEKYKQELKMQEKNNFVTYRK